MIDPYQVLGVSPTATQAEITHAYRRQLRAYHPDLRTRVANSGADERLQRILDAYALLRDPRRRAEHDNTRPTRDDSGPVRIPVTRTDYPHVRPPLWAGPVRWHRR